MKLIASSVVLLMGPIYPGQKIENRKRGRSTARPVQSLENGVVSVRALTDAIMLRTLKKMLGILRKIWQWLEHVHTGVWILGLAGLTGASVARFKLHMPESPIMVIGIVSIALLLVGLSLTAGLYRRQRVALTVLDVKPEPARDRPEIVFKSKLRVVLRNNSSEIILVRAPQWGYTPDSSTTYWVPNWSRLQLESRPGGWERNLWEREAEEINVKPNQAFRASVALDESISDDTVRRLLLHKNLGKMVLPLYAAGRNVQHTIFF
jgi:hypothetical protein